MTVCLWIIPIGGTNIRRKKSILYWVCDHLWKLEKTVSFIDIISGRQLFIAVLSFKCNKYSTWPIQIWPRNQEDPVAVLHWCCCFAIDYLCERTELNYQLGRFIYLLTVLNKNVAQKLFFFLICYDLNRINRFLGR